MKMFSKLLSLGLFVSLLATLPVLTRDCDKKPCCVVGSYIGTALSDQQETLGVGAQFHEDGTATIILLNQDQTVVTFVGAWKCLKHNCFKFCTKKPSSGDIPGSSLDGEICFTNKICFTDNCRHASGKATQTTIIGGKPTKIEFTTIVLERVDCCE